MLTCSLSEDDIEGGPARFRQGLVELIYRLVTKASQSSDVPRFLKDSETDRKDHADEGADDRHRIVPVVDPNETYL